MAVEIQDEDSDERDYSDAYEEIGAEPEPPHLEAAAGGEAGLPDLGILVVDEFQIDESIGG